jgi:hypothetical protein
MAPANEAEGADVNVILEWSDVEKADNYHVQIATSSSFSSYVVDKKNVATTTLKLSGTLENGTTYYWRVRAIDGSNESDWSVTWNFTIEGSSSSGGGGTDTGGDGTDTGGGGTDTGGGGTDTGGGGTISGCTDFSNDTHGFSFCYPGDWEFVSGEGTPETMDGLNFGEIVTVAKVDTVALELAMVEVLVFWPVEEMQDLDLLLEFGESTASDVMGGTVQSSQKTTVNGYDAVKTIYTRADEQLDFKNLDIMIPYNDRLFLFHSSTFAVDFSKYESIFLDIAGTVSLSDVSSGGGGSSSCTKPSAPSLSSPSSGATGSGASQELTWNSVSGAESYGLQVASNSSFTSVGLSRIGLTSTSFTVNGLENGTKYYWRVNATNSCGTGAWSSYRSFTTPSSSGSTTSSCPSSYEGYKHSKYGFGVCLPDDWAVFDSDSMYGSGDINLASFIEAFYIDTVALELVMMEGMVYWPTVEMTTDMALAFGKSAVTDVYQASLVSSGKTTYGDNAAAYVVWVDQSSDLPMKGKDAFIPYNGAMYHITFKTLAVDYSKFSSTFTTILNSIELSTGTFRSLAKRAPGMAMTPLDPTVFRGVVTPVVPDRHRDIVHTISTRKRLNIDASRMSNRRRVLSVLRHF